MNSLCRTSVSTFLIVRSAASLECNLVHQQRGLRTFLKPCWEIKTQHRNKSFRAFLQQPIERINRFFDRLYARWLYFRYEGSLGPQPESFTVKQRRRGNIFNVCIITVLLIIVALGQNFNPHFSSPFIVGMKVWPDNIEEYRDILDAKYGKVSSPKSPSSPTSSSSPPPLIEPATTSPTSS